MPRLVFVTVALCFCTLLLASCGGEPLKTDKLLTSDGGLTVLVEDWEEGFAIYVRKEDAENIRSKVIGSVICSDVDVFWSEDERLIINYGMIEATYFASLPYPRNFSVDLCRRGTKKCLPEPESALKIQGCFRRTPSKARE